MKKPFPLKAMLQSKDKQFAELFKKVMNLHLGVSVGKPIADKDRIARVLQAIKESLAIT